MTRTKRRKFSTDGAFWGGVLTLCSVGSLLAVIFLAATGRLDS